MSEYLMWLTVHVGAVVISLCLFAYRAARSLRGDPVVRGTVLWLTPHLIDTVLVASAVRLMFFIQQYPLVNAWLTAKLIAVVAYIALGSIALRASSSRWTRLAALVAAFLTACYILRTAWLHSPVPF